jgi:hypothetical protein
VPCSSGDVSRNSRTKNSWFWSGKRRGVSGRIHPDKTSHRAGSRQSFEAGLPNYQSLDAALMPAIKRRDNALRQLEHWRDGLGLKTRRLSNLCSAAARKRAAGQRA